MLLVWNWSQPLQQVYDAINYDLAINWIIAPRLMDILISGSAKEPMDNRGQIDPTHDHRIRYGTIREGTTAAALEMVKVCGRGRKHGVENGEQGCERRWQCNRIKMSGQPQTPTSYTRDNEFAETDDHAFTVLAMQANATISTERKVRFDTDSASIGIDNRCSACISHCRDDFEPDSLKKCNRIVKGFGGTRVTNVQIGTLPDMALGG
jgi:hypothetical protein